MQLLHPPTFRLRTFGATALERSTPDGGWELAMRPSKPLALLVYLATVPGRALMREHLADLLWGDESPDNSRASLRQAVYALKQVLGDDILLTEREVIMLLDDAIACDRDAFIDAMHRNDLDAMLAEYGGAFCETIFLSGAAEYDRWMRAERVHLERVLVERAQQGITARIAAGASTEALDAARALDRHLPQRSEVQVLLFDALVAAGGRLEAVERLSAHAAQLASQDLPIPPQIAERMTRVRRAALEPAISTTASLASIGQQLIGRDGLLAELSREAELARGGGSRRVLLNGPAGVGKTRVLDELEARLRLRGARVVRVSPLPSMQDVKYAALVELVRAVCELPGALGISEHSASQLVRLLPELRSRFPGALRDISGDANGVRGLQSAVADLLSSVAEERLVVIMLDNLHHADAHSLEVLGGLQPQASSRLLELWTSRSSHDFGSSANSSVIDVMPLGESDVVALLATVAIVPEAAWMHGLAAALFRRSRGVPLLVLAAIRSLSAAALLRIINGTWASERPDALLEMANATAGTSALVAGVDADARLALEMLAAWGRPMEERDLLGALSGATRSVGDDEWRACLRRLESLGLVQSRDVTWAVAHDTVADELRASPSPVRDDAPRELLFAYWTAPQRLSVGVLEHLGLIAGQESSPELAMRLARVAQRQPRLAAAGLRGRELTRRIARQAGHPDWDAEIARSLGFFARQSDTTRLAITVGMTLAVTGLLVLGARLQPRIVIESTPMAEYGVAGLPEELVVQPRARITDGFGRQSSLEVPVRVSVDHGRLVGETLRRTVNGRVQFEGIGLMRGDPEAVGRPVHVSFHGPWWVRSARTEIPGMRTSIGDDEFRIVELKANGVPVSNDLIVTAGARDSIRFDIAFEYTTVHPTANYIVGAMPSWGDREKSAIRLAGLPRPVVSAWRSVTFSVPPPDRPGEQYVVIMMDSEDTVEHMFSGTSWQTGLPQWNDGNDILDQSREVFENLRRSGRAVVQGKNVAAYRTRQSEYRLDGEIIPRTSGLDGRGGAFEGPRAIRGRAVLVRFTDD